MLVLSRVRAHIKKGLCGIQKKMKKQEFGLDLFVIEVLLRRLVEEGELTRPRPLRVQCGDPPAEPVFQSRYDAHGIEMIARCQRPALRAYLPA